MDFNPLGTFDPAAPLTEAAIVAAVEYAKLLKSKYPCPPGTLKRIYRHWTVGHYGQDFNDYNGALRFANGHFYFDVCGNPQDNAIGVNDNDEHSHTYMRNTGAFGFATDDMAFADEHNFGPEPITLATTDWMCSGVAAVACAYDIDLSGTAADGPYAGEHISFSHGEAANHPGNPPQYANYYVTGERWDWATEVPLPDGMSNANIDPSIMGNALRQREHAYKIEIERRLATT